MTTKAQIAANRRNAARSTGPKAAAAHLATRVRKAGKRDASCGCGGGSPGEPTPQEGQGVRPGASPSTPLPQPRGEDDQPSAGREVCEHENATNEAKLESAQGTTGKEVTSSQERQGDDERTQSSRLGDGADGR